MSDSIPVWINYGKNDLDIAKFVIEGDGFVEYIVAGAVSELRRTTRGKHLTFASAIAEGNPVSLRAVAEAIYLRISDDCHLLYEFERAFDDTTKEQRIRLPFMTREHPVRALTW